MASSSGGPRRTSSQEPGPPHKRPILTSLVAVGVVMLTVVAAFVLALGDLPVNIQPPLPTPIAAQLTPETRPPSPTATPLPLPTTAPPSGLPAQATPTSTASPVPAPTLTIPPTSTASPTSITVVVTVYPTATPTYRPPTPTSCIPPRGWIPYMVERGDTLVLIAWRYQTTVPQLVQANCLQYPAVYPGQVIYVPPQAPTPTRPPCGPPPNWVIYVAQAGDTLYSLAVRTQTTIYQIMHANCLTDYIIYVGQKLWLPFIPPPLPTPTFSPTSPATATYTPTGTNTPVIDTPTPTASSTPGVDTPTPTPSPTIGVDTPTPTVTSMPPTDTPTIPPPTATFTPLPPTPTPTGTPTEPPPTPTIPPPATATDTPSPTATPPPPTNTPVPFIPPPQPGG